MIKQVKKVLDENNIKYNVDTDLKVEQNGEVIYVDIDIAEEDMPKEIVTIVIWINKFVNRQILNIMIPEVATIPSSIRDKVKNYLLEVNAFNMLGSFGIVKRQKVIKFSFVEYLSISDKGNIFEVRKIPFYLSLLGVMVSNIRKDIYKLQEK